MTDYQPKAPCANCEACPLQNMPFVPSYKPLEAPELIMLGEAPGYYETQAREPFVGASGRLLNAVLDHIGVDPKSVYKTNVVLCQPPQNKLDKYPEAIRCCAPRLEAELAACEAETVVALGGTALSALDRLNSAHGAASPPDKGILKRRGNWYNLGLKTKNSIDLDTLDLPPLNVKPMVYLATLHPAFVLRSAGYMAQFLQDMRSIMVDRSNGKDWLKTDFQVVGNGLTLTAFLHFCEEAIANNYRIAFDVETANLDTKSELLALGIAANDESAYILSGDLIRTNPVVRSALNALFKNTQPIAHNAKFDQRVLMNNGIEYFPIANDTMLAHYALDEQAGTHGLKNLATGFLGVPDYEALLVDKYFRADKRESKDYSKISLADLYQYLAIDCCATYALDKLFAELIIADEVEQAHEILIAGSNALLKTELNGIKIDKPYLEKVLVKLTEAIEKAERTVKQAAQPHVAAYLENVPSTEWKHLKGIKWIKTVDQYRAVLYKCLDINLNSWQQLQVLLYDVLELKHIKKLSFKTDPRSTNAEALDALEDHEFVTILSEFRRLAKIKGTYVEKLLALADENDRVHIRFNLHGTETGRLSANDALHGIPRPEGKQDELGNPIDSNKRWGAAIRGSFIAEQGHKLVIADYSQAELRCYAAETQEPFLLDAFNNDRDPHTETAILLFGDRYLNADKDTKKQLRTIAKNVNFGNIYQGGANGIASMLGGKVTAQQLIPILDKYRQVMPVAHKWNMDQFRKARDQGFVSSRFGNKRRFMLITQETLDDVKKASVNAVIQNEASQLTLLSAIELTNMGVKILHLVHDSIIAECTKNEAPKLARLIKRVMCEVGVKYFPEVKWKADVEIGSKWYKDRPTFN